jgi:hypothetical protein
VRTTSDDGGGWTSASVLSAWDDDPPELETGRFFLCSDEALGEGVRCSGVNRADSCESDDDTGSTDDVDDDGSSTGLHDVRPRIVSFERDHATNDSVSVIGTSSSVTTKATAFSSGEYSANSKGEQEAESGAICGSMRGLASESGTSLESLASRNIEVSLVPITGSSEAPHDDATIATLEEALRADRRWLW